MPDAQKLIFVCNTSWSIYKFRLGLIRELIKAGYTVYALAPEDRYSNYLRNEKGLIFIRLHYFKATSLSLFNDWMLYRELRKHYLQIRPNLIFHYTIKANIYGTLAAAGTVPVSISVITGLGYTFLNNIWMSRIAAFMYKFVLRKAREVWFLNNDDRNYFTEKEIVPLNKTYILPGEGIDTAAFVSKNNSHGQSTLTFLLIGRILKEKGIAEYARAAQLLKQKGYAINFQLVGFYDHKNPSAISHKKFSEWIDSGTITYLGGTDEILPFIEKADCIVLPSYREGLPVSLLEAASMSRPLIATDTAGCREVVEHGKNGFLCLPRDAESLARAMEAFYHLSPEARIKMGEEGRALATGSFAKEKIIDIYFSKISAYNLALKPAVHSFDKIVP